MAISCKKDLHSSAKYKSPINKIIFGVFILIVNNVLLNKKKKLILIKLIIPDQEWPEKKVNAYTFSPCNMGPLVIEKAVRSEVTEPLKRAMRTRPIITQMMENTRAACDFGHRSPYLE